MKAFLLAAGVGSRLAPLTDTMPKCMMPIGGVPLLERWLTALRSAGAEEVVVNTHHHAGVVERYLRGVDGVRTAYEPVLLGSAGTLLAHSSWVKGEDFFLACNADNLTDFDLRHLVCAQRTYRPLATLCVRRTGNPAAGGVVEVSAGGVVTGFEEKPARPRSDLMNAGMYAFRPSVLRLLEARLAAGVDGGPGAGLGAESGAGLPCDIGYDLLPLLVGEARVVIVDGYFRDIGTVESYQRAQQEWIAR